MFFILKSTYFNFDITNIKCLMHHAKNTIPTIRVVISTSMRIFTTCLSASRKISKNATIIVVMFAIIPTNAERHRLSK